MGTPAIPGEAMRRRLISDDSRNRLAIAVSEKRVLCMIRQHVGGVTGPGEGDVPRGIGQRRFADRPEIVATDAPGLATREQIVPVRRYLGRR